MTIKKPPEGEEEHTPEGVKDGALFIAPDLPWRLTKWGDFDNYECKFCPHATLDKREALEHYQERHAGPDVRWEPLGVHLVDRHGNPITHKAVSNA